MSSDKALMIINISNLRTRLLEDENLINMLLGDYLGHVDVFLNDLKTAISNRDFEEARRVSHMMKGSAANVSAEQLTEKLRILENETTQENLLDLDSRLLDIDHALADFKQAVSQSFNPTTML